MVKRIGPFYIQKGIRRSELKQWFSISPVRVQRRDGEPWHVCGIGIYGPKTGIVLDWYKLIRNRVVLGSDNG